LAVGIDQQSFKVFNLMGYTSAASIVNAHRTRISIKCHLVREVSRFHLHC
jgi:hypothetical protein